MIPLQAVMKFASVSKQTSPSFLCHFNRVYIRNIFLFAVCLSMTRQLFGDVIVCNHQYQKIPEDYLEMECYINGTFTYKQINETTSTIIYHSYYQWISIILLLEAFAFWLPFQLLWSMWFREFTRCEKTMTIDCILREIQRSGRYAYWKTFGLECIYLCNLIFQGVMIDMFVNYGFSKGYTLTEIFPPRGFCYLDYYSGGDITTGRFLCLLPLNILYKRIFSVMFIGFWILLTIHCIVLIIRIIVAVFPVLRRGRFREDVNKWWFAQIMKQNLNGSDIWEYEQAIK